MSSIGILGGARGTRAPMGFSFLCVAAVTGVISSAGEAAAQTVTVPLAGDGALREWSPSAGTAHYSLLGASCDPSTHISALSEGARDSLRASLYPVPMGSTITAVEITPCATGHAGSGARLQVFAVASGVQTADFGDYTVGQGDPTSLGTTVIPMSMLRSPSSTLDVGVRLGAGAGGARVAGLTVRVSYIPAPTFSAPGNLVALNLGPADNLLSWSDMTTGETSIRVERSLNNTTSWALAATLAANTTSWRDSRLVADQTYYYRLQATSSVTGQTSAFSGTASAITYSTAPASPRNLYSTSTPSGVALAWTRASNNDDGVVIERSTDAASFVELARTLAGATAYTDTTAGQGGALWYRARAFNAVGTSDPSNVASNVEAPSSGPDLVVRAASSSSRGPTQLTTFTVDYSNEGDRAASGACLTALVPENTTFVPADSSASWRCHNPNADTFLLQANIGRVVRALRVRYPNLKQVFISSQMYSGYASVAGVVEPYAYEGGFAVKAAIEAQIQQMRTGRIDPLAGDLDSADGTAPWIAWGPYLWANGATPNGQGLSWETADFGSDLSHPSAAGGAKFANLYLGQLLSSPFTPWFRAVTIEPPPVLPVGTLPSPAPLVDMTGGQRYLGLEGGLYPEGSNEVPADHAARGVAAGREVQPLDVDGSPSAAGKIVFLSVGFSNSLNLFGSLITASASDPRVRPLDRTNGLRSELRLQNGAVGGGVAGTWSSPTDGNYDVVRQSLTGWGYSEQQVQVVWFNAANNAGPAYATSLSGTAAGTTCTCPIGALPASASGSSTFTVRTSFTMPRSITLSVTGLDDGTSGVDLSPSDNATARTQLVVP